jgi:hypothetical protein
MVYLSSMQQFPESYHRLYGGSDSLRIEPNTSHIGFHSKPAEDGADGSAIGGVNPRGKTEVSVLDSLDEELNQVLAFVEEVEHGNDPGFAAIGTHRSTDGDPPARIGAQTHGTIDEKFTRLVIACLDAIQPSASSSVMTPYRLKSFFNDKIVATSENSWVTGDQSLRSRVLLAFRYAVKLAIDEISMIGTDSDEELMVRSFTLLSFLCL